MKALRIMHGLQKSLYNINYCYRLFHHGRTEAGVRRRKGNQQSELPTKAGPPSLSELGQLSPQPLRTPPGHGDPARAAFFLTVGCGWASGELGYPQTGSKSVVQVHFSPKSFGSVGEMDRGHADRNDRQIPGHTRERGDSACSSGKHRSSPPLQPPGSPWMHV